MKNIQSTKVFKSIASYYYTKKEKSKEKKATDKTQVFSVLSNGNCQRLVEVMLDPR